MTIKSLVRAGIRRHLASLIGALCMGLVSVAMGLARPWPLKFIVDDALSHGSSNRHAARWFPSFALGPHDPFAIVIVAALAIVAIAALQGLADYLQALWLTIAGERVVANLRQALFSHIARLSLEFHGSRRTGDLLAHLTSDIQAIEALITSGLATSVTSGLGLIGMMIVTIAIDWKFGFLSLAIVPLLYVIVNLYTRRIKVAVRGARKREGNLASVVQEVLSTIDVVHAFSAEAYDEERFAAISEQSYEAVRKAIILQAQIAPLVALVVAIGTAGLVLFGSHRVLAHQLTIGELLVSLTYLAQMYGPMRQLSKLGIVVTRANASAERISEILAICPAIVDAPNARELESPSGAISFAGVRFGYGDGPEILKGIDLQIEPGATVAIVGATGAGKSTIARLLLRFFDPTAGSVCIDGIDLREIRIASLRRAISVVAQDSVLFATTIRENIAYGNPYAPFEDVVAAAREANAHDFVTALPDGYETVVGERGATLSGGQRQRIAIARAIVRRAPILVLDEPTSALDGSSEHAVVEALERARRGRTTIVIAHRLSTIRAADRIVVLRDGRIAEHGTHDELLAQHGHYHDLLQHSFPIGAHS